MKLALLVVKENAPGQRRALRLAAVAKVRRALRESGFKIQEISRAKLRGPAGGSLVVAAGGDGTLLAAAQHLKPGQALLGVNTDPSRSVGFLCGAGASTFRRVLRSWLEGKTRPRRPRRLALRLKTKESLRSATALNDILVCSRHPAGTSRYNLSVRKGTMTSRETQRGSGRV